MCWCVCGSGGWGVLHTYALLAICMPSACSEAGSRQERDTAAPYFVVLHALVLESMCTALCCVRFARCAPLQAMSMVIHGSQSLPAAAPCPLHNTPPHCACCARCAPPQAMSMGIHESQSLLWERMVGLSRPFQAYLFPLIREAFPEVCGWSGGCCV